MVSFDFQDPSTAAGTQITDVLKDKGTMFGLFGSALGELATAINFTVELVSVENMFGDYSIENDSWSGVIGKLATKEVDMGVAEFGRSVSRLLVVDFTVPLLIPRVNLYFRKPNDTVVPWSIYTQVI